MQKLDQRLTHVSERSCEHCERLESEDFLKTELIGSEFRLICKLSFTSDERVFGEADTCLSCAASLFHADGLTEAVVSKRQRKSQIQLTTGIRTRNVFPNR